MPRPTNIPSVMTNTAEKTIPMTVGKRKAAEKFADRRAFVIDTVA